MPSILIECGFLTNPKEEDFLHSEKGQDYLASAIFMAFRTYKGNFEGASLEKKVAEPMIGEKENTSKILEPKKEFSAEKVLFKVQIGTYSEPMLNDALFKEINAEEEILNGIFKYYVGNETNKLAIDKLKLKMKEKGFKGAFVIAFFKGYQISTKEALSLQSKNNSYE